MNQDASAEGLTYAAAGVDTEAADRAVELMKSAIARTHNHTVLDNVGGFAGLIDISELKNYRRPLLASSTDGVGTKIAIAKEMGIHHTIGEDLVAMVVDDIVVCGAKPLAMTDYIACGRVEPERIADIVKGIARGCELAQTPLVGGETAEHPGLMAPDDYDVAGAAVGVVEADEMLGAERVEAANILIAIGSSGIHSNGFSLVRAVIAKANLKLESHIAEFGKTLGEELLTPTKIYTASLLKVIANTNGAIKALSHVTGGGLGANLARIMPNHLAAVVNRDAWDPGVVFDFIKSAGAVPLLDLEATLNMGVGMVAVVASEQADEVISELKAEGLSCAIIGEVLPIDKLPAKSAQTDALIQGAKGVDGGSVLLRGLHQGLAK